MKLLKAFGAVAFISSVATCMGIGGEPVFGQACTPFSCPQSPQAQAQPQYPGPYPQYPTQLPQAQPGSIYPPPQQSGTQVPINQGYNFLGGIWFGPDGRPVSADRRSGEDQASCIARVSFFPLEAYSRSEQHGDYRYNRPNNITEQQMYAAGLENRGSVFGGEKWRSSQPQVTLTVMDSQQATIRCR